MPIMHHFEVVAVRNLCDLNLSFQGPYSNYNVPIMHRFQVIAV